MKLLPGLAALLLLAACQSKDDTSFLVDGTLKGAQGNKIYLEEMSFNTPNSVIVDSATADAKGGFSVKGKRVEEGLYLLRRAGAQAPFAMVVNDAAHIKVSADPDNADRSFTVDGSPASRSLTDYMDANNAHLSKLIAFARQGDSLQRAGISDSLLTPLVQQQQKEAADFKAYTEDYIRKNRSGALAVFALGSYQSYASNPALGVIPFTREEFNTLLGETATRFPKNTGIAQLQSTVLARQQADSAAPPPPPAGPADGISDASRALLGKPAPDLTMPDAAGKPVSIASFRGKWVLVDFWASWCAPCRAENPNVVQAYNRFKDKNFTVLGVSLDKSKESWIAAIQKDGLAWPQMSDLKYWQSAAQPAYGFEGIPFNVLIDPKGTVVAMGLRGPALEQKLAEVLK